MSDIDRVRQMADEGHITKQEADQLIAVLRDVEAAEANLEAAGSGGSTLNRASASPNASPTVPTAPTTGSSAQGSGEAQPARTEPVDSASIPDDDATPESRRYAAPSAHADQAAARDATPEDARDLAHDPVSDSVREAARDAREAVRNAVRDARDAAREASREARDAAKHAAREARDSAREASRFARETGREVRSAVSGLGHLEVGDIGERPDKAIAPADTPWVIVEMIGGDLDVRVDETLDGPVVEGGPGNIEIERDGGDFRVKFMPERGNIIDRFLSTVRSGDLDIRIPPHFGLSVQATAGDVDLLGVRYLRGRLRAGDVSADVLEGVDFALMAGEFDATLDLRSGSHVVTVGAGDVRVALPSDADVTVTGRVSIGDLDSQLPDLGQRGVGLGSEVAGSLGHGTANLQLRVTTGDLSIRPARSNHAARSDRG